MIINNPKIIKDLNLIIYFRKTSVKDKQGKLIKNIYTAYETEDTIKNLLNILDKIKTQQDLCKLYDELGYKTVDKISSLVVKYTDYLYSFYDHMPKEGLLIKH